MSNGINNHTCDLVVEHGGDTIQYVKKCCFVLVFLVVPNTNNAMCAMCVFSTGRMRYIILMMSSRIKLGHFWNSDEPFFSKDASMIRYLLDKHVETTIQFFQIQ